MHTFKVFGRLIARRERQPGYYNVDPEVGRCRDGELIEASGQQALGYGIGEVVRVRIPQLLIRDKCEPAGERATGDRTDFQERLHHRERLKEVGRRVRLQRRLVRCCNRVKFVHRRIRDDAVERGIARARHDSSAFDRA